MHGQGVFTDGEDNSLYKGEFIKSLKLIVISYSISKKLDQFNNRAKKITSY
jgi:hypothetical protein